MTCSRRATRKAATTSTSCASSSSIRFAARALIQELGRFKFAEIVWCQEEPKNMGAWYFMDANIEWVLNHLGYIHRRPRYAGRPASASTATGLLSQHIKEQTALVADALGT